MSEPGKGSYTGLYYGAVSAQRRGLEGLGAILAILLIAVFLGEPLYRFVADPQVDRLSRLAALVAFLTLVGVAIYFIQLISLVFSLSQSPARVVPRAAARLLLAARPYSAGDGLTLNDIHRLKRIAEIEQRSAAWRGNFLNFAGLGILVLVVLALPALQSLFSTSSEPSAGLVFDRFFARLPWSGQAGAASSAGELVGLALVGLLTLWLAGHWVRYIKGFIASEYANRVVLMACEEIIALFENLQIPRSWNLAFRERRAMVERFGCRLVPQKRLGWFDRVWGKLFEIRLDGKTYGSWLLK